MSPGDVDIYVDAGCFMDIYERFYFLFTIVDRRYATAHDVLLELLFCFTEAPAGRAALELLVRHTPSVCIIVENPYLDPTISLAKHRCPLLTLCSEVDPIVTRHHIV